MGAGATGHTYNPRDYLALRRQLGEAAGLLAGEVMGNTVQEDDKTLLGALAEIGTDFVLTWPLGSTPTELPDQLVTMLTQFDPVAPCGDQAADAVRRKVIHDAFTFAAQYLAERAFVSAVPAWLVQHWMSVMQSVENLAFDVRVETVRTWRRQRDLHGHLAAAELLDGVVGGDATIARIIGGLRRDGADLSGVTEQLRPPAWTRNGEVAVTAMLLRSPADLHARREPPVLDPATALVALGCHEAVVVTPRGPDIARRLQTQFAGCQVIVGLPVHVSLASSSVEWCERALHLHAAGMLPPHLSVAFDKGEPLHCDSIVSELIIGADEQLVTWAADRMLQPLRELTPYRRASLVETLVGWSRFPQAGVPALARYLNRHPQTVRYRLKQLHDILGNDLFDVEQHRFGAGIALRLEGLGRRVAGVADGDHTEAADDRRPVVHDEDADEAPPVIIR